MIVHNRNTIVLSLSLVLHRDHCHSRDAWWSHGAWLSRKKTLPRVDAQDERDMTQEPRPSRANQNRVRGLGLIYVKNRQDIRRSDSCPSPAMMQGWLMKNNLESYLHNLPSAYLSLLLYHFTPVEPRSKLPLHSCLGRGPFVRVGVSKTLESGSQCKLSVRHKIRVSKPCSASKA